MQLSKIVIIGVGLIGGSFAMALRRHFPSTHMVGIGRQGENLQQALQLGVVNEIATEATAHNIADADLIVVAAPVAQTDKILTNILPFLSAKTVITDVGSTKSDVVAAATIALGAKVSQFVAGHPIAGAEKSGVTAAKADLFVGKHVILTPNDATQPEALSRVRQAWELTGAVVSEMPPATHDSVFAAVSHLPHLLAFALVEDLAKRPNAAQLFNFAASGFRDFTRIAGSSPEMWRDIALANKDALLSELDAYAAQLETMKALLVSDDSAGLESLFQRASDARNNWGKTH